MSRLLMTMISTVLTVFRGTFIALGMLLGMILNYMTRMSLHIRLWS